MAGPPVRNPSPDPRYPFVGQYYQGEVPGYVYNPWKDRYYIDPKSVQEYQYNVGLAERPVEPEKPSLFDQVAPIAAAGLATSIGEGIGKNPGGFFGGISEGVGDLVSGAGGLFGLGGGGAAVAPITEATTATGSAGLLGLGGGAGGAATTASGLPAAAGYTASGLPAAAGGGTSAGAAGGAGAGSGLFGIGALPAAGVAGGIALGAKGLLDTIEGDDTSGALDWGSRATIGIATGGLSEVYRVATDLFGSKNRWKKEKNNLNRLKEDGVYIPDNLIEGMPTGPRKNKEDLMNKEMPDDYIGFTPDGTWVNNKFAQSREVNDLRPEDIVNYSAFAENDPQWFTKPLVERLQVANAALQSNAVNEHHGTIDVDFGKFDTANVGGYTPIEGNPTVAAEGVAVPQAPAPAPQPPQQPAPAPAQVPQVPAGSLPALPQAQAAPPPQQQQPQQTVQQVASVSPFGKRPRG